MRGQFILHLFVGSEGPGIHILQVSIQEILIDLVIRAQANAANGGAQRFFLGDFFELKKLGRALGREFKRMKEQTKKGWAVGDTTTNMTEVIAILEEGEVQEVNLIGLIDSMRTPN